MGVALALALAVAEIAVCGSDCGCVRDLWDESCDLLVALTVVVPLACR